MISTIAYNVTQVDDYLTAAKDITAVAATVIAVAVFLIWFLHRDPCNKQLSH